MVNFSFKNGNKANREVIANRVRTASGEKQILQAQVSFLKKF